jgi:hypothetical protein
MIYDGYIDYSYAPNNMIYFEDFNNDISDNSTDVLPTVYDKQVKISIECFPSEKLYSILNQLRFKGYPIINDTQKWLNLLKQNTEYILPYFLNQLINNSENIIHPTGFEIHYNMYGTNNIWFPWMKKNKTIPENRLQILENTSTELNNSPDYLIYLYDEIENPIKSDLPFSHEQIKNVHAEYEWFLENTHCDFPVFKVNINDSVENIVKTIIKILKQIKERLIMGLDLNSDSDDSSLYEFEEDEEDYCTIFDLSR